MFISFDLGVSSNDKVPYEATEEQEAWGLETALYQLR